MNYDHFNAFRAYMGLHITVLKTKRNSLSIHAEKFKQDFALRHP